MTKRDKVFRVISMSNGITTNAISEKLHISRKEATAAVVGLHKRGALKTKPSGEGRGLLYFPKPQKVSSSVAPGIVLNPLDAIKNSKFNKMSDEQVISTFSDADRSNYFGYLEKGEFYMNSGKLLVDARRERLIKESEVKRV